MVIFSKRLAAAATECAANNRGVIRESQSVVVSVVIFWKFYWKFCCFLRKIKAFCGSRDVRRVAEETESSCGKRRSTAARQVNARNDAQLISFERMILLQSSLTKMSLCEDWKRCAILSVTAAVDENYMQSYDNERSPVPLPHYAETEWH